MKKAIWKYIAVSLAAVMIVTLAAVFMPDARRVSGGEKPSGSEPESEEGSLTESEPESESESEPESETEPDTPPSSGSEQKETTGGTESESERLSDISGVAFIGDSRTVFMGSQTIDGVTGSRILPDSALFATYGGRLVYPEVFRDAENAAVSGRRKAVFWFGVNDVQKDENRSDAGIFIHHYDALIRHYRERNASATIYLLSVVDSAKDEKDYYEGQRENIAAYNRALRAYAAEKGYVFVDLSPVVGDDPDRWMREDRIHFTDEFYGLLLPFLENAVGFRIPR